MWESNSFHLGNILWGVLNGWGQGRDDLERGRPKDLCIKST